MKTKLNGIGRLLSRLMFVLCAYCLIVGMPCQAVRIICGLFVLGCLAWLELAPYWFQANAEEEEERQNELNRSRSIDVVRLPSRKSN